MRENIHKLALTDSELKKMIELNYQNLQNENSKTRHGLKDALVQFADMDKEIQDIKTSINEARALQSANKKWVDRFERNWTKIAFVLIVIFVFLDEEKIWSFIHR
jgi:predicted  nucleic acid-binding Zn-ribbon protein